MLYIPAPVLQVEEGTSIHDYVTRPLQRISRYTPMLEAVVDAIDDSATVRETDGKTTNLESCFYIFIIRTSELSWELSFDIYNLLGYPRLAFTYLYWVNAEYAATALLFVSARDNVFLLPAILAFIGEMHKLRYMHVNLTAGGHS